MKFSHRAGSFFLLAVLMFPGRPASGQSWMSEEVGRDAEGRLQYAADAEGNRIPDFSHAGYRGGGVPLPDVPVVKTISPIPGDNTPRLQAALDEVGKLPAQKNGYRGTLLLTAGIFELQGTLHLDRGGVVLAGAGDGGEPGKDTILRRTGHATDPVIRAGGKDAADQFKTAVPGTVTAITSPFVPVGARSFEVASADGFQVGDTIIIAHPSTEKWLKAVDYGGTGKGARWQPGEIDIRYHRYITGMAGQAITVDAPVFNALDRDLSPSVIYRYDNPRLVREIGIEKLFIDIETSGPTSEDHAANAVVFSGAENCWIRHVTARHFVHSGIQFGPVCTRSTALSCRALEPHSLIEGRRRYNFGVYQAQLILFEDCLASYARHAFVSNGTSLDSGIVFLDCVNEHSYAASEGHRRWPQGLLFDGLRTIQPETSSIVLGLYNRGSFGTSHGWAAVNSVAWRCDVADRELAVQKPPTAQNHAIGCFGKISGKGRFDEPPGFIEGANRDGLAPASLYRAQLAERLSNPPKSP